MIAMRVVTHSARAMRRYKLRSGFMMLGCLIGVGALTLVVSIGEGAERKIMTTVRQLFGARSLFLMTRGSVLLGGPRPEAARLTLDDLEAVAAGIPEIETWDPQQSLPDAAVRHRDASATARVIGQSERAEQVWERSVSRGEYFDAAAVAGSARVALVGETTARELFGTEDALDAEILIESVPFRVIGVLEPQGTDVHGMDRDDEIVVPISTLMRRVLNVDTISSARLLVRDPSRSEETAREVGRVLRERHGLAEGRPNDFTLVTPIEVQKMVARSQSIFALYLPLVAAIALVAGGIVAATLMLVSVNERVGEIGLRRAVGARPENIRLQFLVETALTTLGGGLGGLVIGYAGAQLAASRMHLGGIFSWKALVVGMALSVVTGVLAGVVPARRAARMHPADALR